jgi:ribosomal protein S18 acetylase RimI-like enzyme
MTTLDTATLSRIEDAGLNASAPPQQLWMDGWLVRLCPGKAKRARCINALAVGHLSLADKLQEAAAAYRRAGLPVVVRLTPFSQPSGLDSELAAHGMQRFDDTLVMAAPVDILDLSPSLPKHLTLARTDHLTYARTVGALRGSPADQQVAHAERMAASPVPYLGWLLWQGNEVLACGQTAQEGSFVGLYDVFTAPAARNQGLSRALCAALLRTAAAQGARIAYLQVEAVNAPAQAVYRRLGFADAYGYHYRSADPASA